MIPGPTPVPLEAHARQPIGHRSKELAGIHRHLVEELKRLARTEGDMFVITASGTGAMEAAVANTVNAGDRVVSLVSGVFGERFAKIAEAYGAQVERIEAEARQPISIDKLRQILQNDSQRAIKAVTVTHNETSTGVINDLESITAAVRAHGALSLVDAVTSFGACLLEVDRWGVDVMVCGSQKALMLPPGMSFVSVSKKAWAAYDSCKTPRFYFDFGIYRKSLENDMTPFTPNVSLMVALQVALKMIKDEGEENVFARHCRLKDVVRSGISAMGLKLFVSERAASPTVTSIIPPEGITVDSIRSRLKERFGIVVADGQESLKGKIFRIGHMGYVFERDVLMTLACLEAVLAELGYNVGSSARLPR